MHESLLRQIRGQARRTAEEVGQRRHALWVADSRHDRFACRLFSQWLREQTGCSVCAAMAYLSDIRADNKSLLDIVNHLSRVASLVPYRRGRPKQRH